VCAAGEGHCNSTCQSAVSKLAQLRRSLIALRRGRQYLHDISGDGEHFGQPEKLGDRLLSLVTWSRVMADHELLLAFNTNELSQRKMYSDAQSQSPTRRRGATASVFIYSGIRC
jgi:hypothetical protein